MRVFLRKRNLLVLILLAVIFTGLRPAHAAPSLTGLINSDFKAGKISFDDALIYKALAVQTPWVLPEEYRPKEPLRDTTPIVLEVLADLSKAHPEVQGYIHYIFASPKERQRMVIPTLSEAPLSRYEIPILSLIYYSAKTDAEYLTPEGHFAIHYATHGRNSSTLAYAQEIGRYLEKSWSHEIGQLGYNAPALGSDGRLDIFIWDLGTGLYGVAFPSVFGLTDGYILVNRDFSWVQNNDDPSGKAVGAMKVTAAHEFFHHIQFAYLNVLEILGESWWIESSATFMEDEVFDEVNDYRNYLIPPDKFFGKLDVSIDSIGGGYESVLINKFLKEKYNGGNPGIVKEVLEGIGVLASTEESMETALGRRSSNLAEGFQHFALWNFFTGGKYKAGYYEEGATYPPLKFKMEHPPLGPSNPSTGEQTDSVDNLAANYYRITPEAGMTGAKKLSIKVARGSDQVRGWVVVGRTGGYEVRELLFNAENKAEEKVDDFSAATISEIVLILSNGDKSSPQTIKYSASIEQGLDLIFVIDTTGSMWDDIANVKAAATEIVNTIDSEIDDYRVAVVDYRDFSTYPYGGSGDYPYHVMLPFSTDKTSVIGAIQGLSIGWGADWPESVYSALTRAIYTEGLGPWRDGVKKAIILMGDAPPHDPEPFTGYTLSSVVAAAESVDPAIIYSIAIGWDSTAYAYFSSLSTQTGGKVFNALTARDVVNAVLEAIGEIGEPGGNNPPNCSAAAASISQIWPPDHKMRGIRILGITDPDGDPVSAVITGITQDEPVKGTGSGNTSPDGSGVGTDTAQVRAERAGKDNSRVYSISFTANDGRGGQCSGSVLVCVPHDQGVNTACIDGGQTYDSTLP